MRLICLPYAGGGSVEYQQWAVLLPPAVEAIPVHLPGRERRFRETPRTRMGALVPELADALAPLLDRPYALFGYSMGAWVAFELVRELRRRGAVQPSGLLAAAALPPDTPRSGDVRSMTDAEVIDRTLRLSGERDSPLHDPRLLRTVLPRLRADLEVADSYEPALEAALPFPIHAYAGDADDLAPPDKARGWARHTSAGFGLRVLSGGHFFLHDRQADLLSHIIDDLEV